MPQGNARKIRTLFLRAEYLNAEVEDARELFDEYKGPFSAAVSSAVEDLSDDSDLSSASKKLSKDLEEAEAAHKVCEESSSPKSELPPDLKGLYRKIMVKVHPDKLTFIEDEDVCKKYSKLATLANEASANVDWYLMIKVANELSIELDNLSPECVYGLEEHCKALSSEAEMLNGSYQMHWGKAVEAAKSVWVNSYIENML